MTEQGPPGPGEVIAWLKDRGPVETVLQSALGALPSERDVVIARMGDVLQATAQGLEPAAAAVWAGVPEPVLQSWIDRDPPFAAALAAARSLAAAHGLSQGVQLTPAMLRTVLVAMSGGATRLEALKLTGFGDTRFRALVKASSTLEALLQAARRVRPPARTRGDHPRVPYRVRRPGAKQPVPRGFRLVKRDAHEEQPE
ncbi:hypothetical protein ACFXEL_25775 [Streptomyces sp. NPDC059382]|uniref:hypothetical protein n=1 Tax=Streptomyces sp. NPDC059382 TaxID=3346816 RepID=UPI0036CB2181